MLPQVQRLIAVLSVPSIGRSALLHDRAPCFARELRAEDKAVLLSAGWTEEEGLRALLNFSGALAAVQAVPASCHNVRGADPACWNAVMQSPRDLSVT